MKSGSSAPRSSAAQSILRRRFSRWGATATALLLLLRCVAGAQVESGVFHALELGPFCTVFSNAAPRMKPFPLGAQTFGGVPFYLDGCLAVTGMDGARRGEVLPTEVKGIPVNQKARRIHLLLGALRGQREGVPLANVVLRFKGGETRMLRLSFGLHARNSVGPEDNPRGELADPNSTLAWQTGDGAGARLYRTVFENPLPDTEMVAIDFVSLFSRATPLLFGITLQSGGGAGPALAPLPPGKVARRAREFGDAAYRREFTLRVGDASGRPLTNAVATLALADGARTVMLGQHRVDARGEAVLAYPPQEAVAVTLRARHPGFASGSASFSAFASQPWPKVVELRLDRGDIIGGVVLDPAGQAVGGAAVVLHEMERTGTNEFTRHDLEVVTTGADGRWSAHASRASLSKLHFEFTHPEFHSTTARFADHDLLSTNTSTTLRPHVVIAGRVVDGAGAPVPRAIVILEGGDEASETHLAGEHGQFMFVVREPSSGPGTLLALATNLTPASLGVALDNTSRSNLLQLDRGRPFSMRINDGDGQPIEDVRVSVVRWQKSQALPWTARSDAQGRFAWDNAPTGSVTFRFEKPGHMNHTHSITLPRPKDDYFNFTRVTGRVVDAATKQPVEQFQASVRYRYLPIGSGNASATGHGGLFSFTMGSITGGGRYTNVMVTLTADGYESLTAPVKPPFVGFTNLFQLRKRPGRGGGIFTPDSKPVLPE